MRRVLIMVLAAVALSSGLAGCGPKETGEPEPTASPSPDGSDSKGSDSKATDLTTPDE
jgi:predicted small lipoprotein YifL